MMQNGRVGVTISGTCPWMEARAGEMVQAGSNHTASRDRSISRIAVSSGGVDSPSPKRSAVGRSVPGVPEGFGGVGLSTCSPPRHSTDQHSIRNKVFMGAEPRTITLVCDKADVS